MNALAQQSISIAAVIAGFLFGDMIEQPLRKTAQRWRQKMILWRRAGR
jgi:hypothetical protein